jgi:hypothetical protein
MEEDIGGAGVPTGLRRLLMGHLKIGSSCGSFLLLLSLFLLFLWLPSVSVAQQSAQSSCIECHLKLGDE